MTVTFVVKTVDVTGVTVVREVTVWVWLLVTWTLRERQLSPDRVIDVREVIALSLMK